MAINIRSIQAAVTSHLESLGLFELVNTVEPTVPGRQGLEASAWFQEMIPIQSSGLNSTSVRMSFQVRLYSMLAQADPDLLDINLVEAVDILLEKYNEDFTLDGLVRCVDIFGQAGDALSAVSGYLPVAEEQPEIRIVDITLPLIVDDVWSQEEVV